MTKGGTYNGTAQVGNACTACTSGCTCAGGTAAPVCGKTCAAGKYWDGSACATCPNGYYCPGFSNVQNPATNYGRNACPAADSTTAAASSDYPDVFYPYTSTSGSVDKTTAPTRAIFVKQSWGMGWSAINACMASYTFEGAGGRFKTDDVKYNSTSGKYDNFSVADIYYSSAVAGYYLYTKYSDTYCNTGTHLMFYRKAVACPAGSYCPGGSVPQCSTGTHNNEWGRNTCPAGKYCPAKSSAATNCAAGTYRSATGGTAASSCTACAIGSYSSAGATGCTACSGGKTTTATGQSSCNATCTNATGASTWTTATWSANSVTNKCAINACATGYTRGGTASSTGTSSYTCTATTNTITLNKNGGTGTCGGQSGTTNGSTTCTTGSTKSLPTWDSSSCSITNGNKIFKGWSTSSSATSGSTSITCPTGAATYYAAWTTPTCSATNGTCAITTPSSNAPRGTISCSMGYSQSGGTNRTTSFTVTGSAGGTSVSGTCYAVTSTVSFNLNGGSGNQPNNVTATYGSNMPALSTSANPSRTGYTFGGWYDTSAATGGTQYYNTSRGSARTWNKTDASVTLYARWTANSYTCNAKYYLNGTTCTLCEAGYSCPSSQQTYTYNGGIQGRTYCAAGTYNTGTGNTSCTTCPAGKYCTGGTNNTACPAGTARSATGGKASGDCTTCSAGTYTSTTGNTSCASCGAGYYCTGGSNRAACSALTGVSVTGGSYTSVSPYNASTTCRYTAPTPTKPGNCATVSVNQVSYTGSAWPTSTYNVTANTGYHTSGSGTASPSCPANTYTVVYNKNNTSATGTTANSSHTYGTAKALTTNGYSLSGYTFNRWTTAADGTGTKYTNGQSVTNLTTTNGGTVNLYAQWCQNCASVSNGSCSLSVADGTCKYTTSCNSGYTISGNGTRNPTCTANGYTVTYKAGDGGSGSDQTQSVTYNANFTTKAANTFTKANATFAGWSASSGSYTSANTSYKYTTVGNVTLTATWNCNAGYTLNSSTRACDPCAAGTYKGSAGNGACSTCAAGTYTSTTGQSSCAACPAGKYCTGGSNVTNCAAGTYRSATGGKAAADCSACSALSGVSVSGGTYTSAAGSTANKACKYTAPNKTITGCGTVTTNQVTYSGSAWPATTYSVTANGGYVIANNNTASATCSACGDGTYSAGGSATSCSACSALTGVSVSGGTYTSVSPRNANTTCRYKAPNKTITGCSAVTTNTVSYSGTAWSATTYNVTANGGYVIANNGSASATCTQCTGSKYSAGGTATACTNCPAAEDSNWTLGTGNGWSAVTSCYETRAATNVSSYCSAGQLKKNATSDAKWPTSASISVAFQAKAGSIVSGQTCTQCSGATFSAGGTATACTACPDQTSGWTRNSGNGWSAVTQCNQTKAVGGNCSEGTLRQNATSTTAWGSSVIHSALKAKAGYIVNGQSCTGCAAGTYSAGGTATACSNCAGRTKYSGANAGSCSDVGTGYYTTGCNASGNNCTGRTQCSGSTYCVSGVQNNCPAAESTWTLGTGTGWSAVTSCFETKAATAVSTYCSEGQLKKNATNTTTWGAATISSAFKAKAGSIVSGQTCTQCTGATYSAGGTVTECAACPTGYASNTTAGKTAVGQCQASCAAGYAVQTANEACKIVASGYQTGTHAVSYGSKTPTAADSTSPAAGTWYSCLTNYSASGTAATDHDARSDCKISCGAGTRIASANATSCTTPSGNWYVGAHSVAAGSTSSVSSCLTNYTIGGSAATDHDAAADCKIRCGGGAYVAKANDTSCTNVGAGYWAAASTVSQGSAGSRTACASGLTTIGYGAGADEAADCGHILHLGDSKLYLRNTKKTTPSLNVKIGDSTFYGNMSTATKGKLRVKKDNTTYSVHDDSM